MKNTPPPTGWNSAADVLERLLPDLPIAGRVKNYRVWELWEEVVGRTVAARAWPSKLQHGKLFVTVSHPAVAQELQFLKGRLVRSLNQALARHGAPPVKALFFCRGPSPGHGQAAHKAGRSGTAAFFRTACPRPG